MVKMIEVNWLANVEKKWRFYNDQTRAFGDDMFFFNVSELERLRLRRKELGI
jgi:hypothetical protein